MLGGFAANEVARSESTNELSDQTTVSTTTLVSGVLTQTTDHPETTGNSISVAYHGRMMQSTQPGVGTTTYGYDDLGRRISTVDPRIGTSSVAYADHPSAAGYTTSLVETATDAATNVTSFEYRAQGTLGAGQVKKVTRPDTTTTWTSYTALGQVQARWGAGIYATYHVYDSYGQMTGLRTYKTLAHGTEPTSGTTGFAETEWNYDAATGLLLSKRYDDDKGPTYTYDTAGRTKTRAWARLGADNTNPILTTYDYTAFGELDEVNYSNDNDETADLNYGYDRLGRITEAAYEQTASGLPGVNYFNYNSTTLALESEIIDYDVDGGSPEIANAAREIVRYHDGHLRATGYEFGPVGFTFADLGAGYNYDGSGRLDRVWKDPAFSGGIPSGAATFTHSYRYTASGGQHVGTASAVGGGVADSGILFHVTGPVHKVINGYDYNRNVLASRENEEISGADDWSKYVYSVNSLGQRTALDLALDPDVNGSGLVSSDVGWEYNGRDEVVEADHEITAHERAYSFDGIGNRTETVAGTTSLTSTPDYTANSLNQYSKVEGTNLPTGAHDDDGNLIDDGTLEYTWDAENRLVRVSGAMGWIAEYGYDFMGRRTLKRTDDEVLRLYYYDHWNLIAESHYEYVENPDPEEESDYLELILDFSYTWGLDLSQSRQGAGGVGGLLAVEKHSSDNTGVYYPTFDGNGNVSEYLDGSGAQVAHYEYDPFGNELSLSSGALKDLFPHRFSTKYHDAETGFYYYGYRFYDPVTGRWPSRDPIEEDGGRNLYGFVANDSISYSDYLGQKLWTPSTKSEFGGEDSGNFGNQGWSDKRHGDVRISAAVSIGYFEHKNCENPRLIQIAGSVFHPSGGRDADLQSQGQLIWGNVNATLTATATEDSVKITDQSAEGDAFKTFSYVSEGSQKFGVAIRVTYRYIGSGVTITAVVSVIPTVDESVSARGNGIFAEQFDGPNLSIEWTRAGKPAYGSVVARAKLHLAPRCCSESEIEEDAESDKK